MDGNGRWAQRRNLPRTAGHQAGMASVRRLVESCLEAGVTTVTVFAFSQENWQRPPEEIDALMALLQEYVSTQSAELTEQGVRVRMLGDLTPLSPPARQAVEFVERATAGGTKLALNICISYGSRAEITRAARRLAEDVAAGRITSDEVTEQAIADRLYTAPWGDPDLLIRTSGEFRISNFLLWQLAYAELYVTPTLWPDFGRREFFEAVLDYQRRDRRFGRVTTA
ncbi:MAG: di-trans,poly-cis-decaprenylcistransferase [Gemmatimonadetes bacterium]|nr:di-trans,poly-cis-decaprenylcistransferase [Gemmatimonadota bacterium]